MDRHEGPVHSGFCLFGAISVFGGLSSSTEIALVLAGNWDTVGVLLSWVKDRNSLHAFGFCAIGRNLRALGQRYCLGTFTRGPVVAVSALACSIVSISTSAVIASALVFALLST